jgi:hypothetical protein
MPDLLRERARVFVEEWAKLKPGERVIVLDDGRAEPQVARAVLDCARATGADVTYLEMASSDGAWSEPNEVVFAAMRKAQKCLSLALVYHDRRTTIARREYGMAMFFLLPPTSESLLADASAFPIELCEEVGRRCAARLRGARQLHVTSRRGTDFRAELDPRNCTADPGGWLEAWDPGRTIGITPGEGSNTFPPGVALAFPTPGTVEGTAVFDHHVGIGATPGGLAVRYEKGVCAGARGHGAERLADLLTGVEHAAEVAEVAFGTNPLQSIVLDTTRNPVAAERHSATVHVGIGPSPIFGARNTSASHLDGLIVQPSIALDGVPLMTDGHLLVLDEPEVRELAASFGDPDVLLRERVPVAIEALGTTAPAGPWVPIDALGSPAIPVETSGDRPASPRALTLLRRLVDEVRSLDEGRWLLDQYRFNVEFALDGACAHIAIDHGTAEAAPGPAPGERLMTVRCECSEATLEVLCEGRVGPVDANLGGRLWVSGSLGTRVLTNCTFRLLRLAQDARRAARDANEARS